MVAFPPPPFRCFTSASPPFTFYLFREAGRNSDGMKRCCCGIHVDGIPIQSPSIYGRAMESPPQIRELWRSLSRPTELPNYNPQLTMADSFAKMRLRPARTKVLRLIYVCAQLHGIYTGVLVDIERRSASSRALSYICTHSLTHARTHAHTFSSSFASRREPETGRRTGWETNGKRVGDHGLEIICLADSSKASKEPTKGTTTETWSIC